MFRIKLAFLIFILFNFLAYSYADENDSNRDYLYSEAYFDYLIECASEEYNKQQELKKEQEKQIEEIKDSEVTVFEFDENDNSSEIFKLRAESNEIGSYSESFKVENSKTSIPLSKNLNLVQDALVFRNKYNSQDYRVIAGFEYNPNDRFSIMTGVETNYRNIDQNPTSKKIFFTPTLKISDKLSLSFYNKYNSQTKTSDHDVGLNISPFESKAVDFRVYAEYTNRPSGNQTKSLNFYTNFYFY